MDIALLTRILRERRRLRSHERLSRSGMQTFQLDRLRELRKFALERSPFYRRFHRGLDASPLEALPLLTKSQLMAAFDELVTDPAVRLAAVEQHLRELRGNERFLGRYWVARTSGSTGHPGIFLANAAEWSAIIASYSRAQEWAGIKATLSRRTRLAVVSSRVPWHQSARVGMSVDSPFFPVRRFDATQPLNEIVAGLNAWQPENLIAYASMARLLADEQLQGRLRIAPRAVMCSSEVLTGEAVERIKRAWGAPPFNVYAATETAGVASECSQHRLHLYEDLVIVEVVDEKNRPVPQGTAGAKILVTVLFSRTQPLIRYEMSDCISIGSDRCDCGLPFAILGTIDGRTEDSMILPGSAGDQIVVHPNVFHRVLEPLHVTEWQVVQELDAIRVLIAGVKASLDQEALRATLTQELRALGATPPPIHIQRVDAVARSPLGKAPLVKALSNHSLHGSFGTNASS